MAASATDKFKKVKGFFSTTLASQKTSGATSMSLSDATGVPTDTGLNFTVGRVDSNGDATPSTRVIYQGTLSGTTVSNLADVEGTDQTHAAGTVVEITWTESHVNDMVDGILAEHAQDGTHTDITADSITNAGNISQTDTSSITDDSGNELIKFSKTASAVNELTVKNAATGNQVQLQATGGDTNIGLKGVPKGSGVNTGFMAVKIGSIAPTGNGQASVTGVGFQPKFIEMHLIPGTSSTVAKMCHGFSDGTTTFSAGFQSVESGDNSRVQSTTLLCFNPSTNGVAVDEITLVSFDADGFTYTKADHAGTETFRYICFG